mmetsp:Transcript_25650/g.86201  ORF Transcript_25650/g.86201 Transcript_25650/m.86201 type:complete len:203 (-) Transcript_25650:293-901(-)
MCSPSPSFRTAAASGQGPSALVAKSDRRMGAVEIHTYSAAGASSAGASSVAFSPSSAAAASSAAASGAASSPAQSFVISACASRNASLNLFEFSAVPNRSAKTSSTRSPSEKSKTDQTQERSEPALGASSMRGSTMWLAMTFIVFSWRIKTRILEDSRCFKSFMSPTPRSIHSFFPEPLFRSVSVKRKSLLRILKMTSSSSS